MVMITFYLFSYCSYIYLIFLSPYLLFSLVLFNVTVSFDGTSIFIIKLQRVYLFFYFTKNSKSCQSSADKCIMLGEKNLQFWDWWNIIKYGSHGRDGHHHEFVFFAYFLFSGCLRRFTRSFPHFLFLIRLFKLCIFIR